MDRAIVFCWSDSNRSPVTIKPTDYIVCADCGYEYAVRIGIRPSLLVGDYDSCNISAFDTEKIEKITLPVEKDDTDTFYAVDTVLKKGYGEVVLAGGIGGPRIDHMFANIQTLRYIYECGARGYISDGRMIIRYMGAHSKLLVPYDDLITTISFVPLCDTKDVCIRGFKYTAEHRDLGASHPLAVSNSMINGQDGCISLEYGEGLVFVIYK